MNIIEIGSWYLCNDGLVRQVTAISDGGLIQWYCFDPGVQWTKRSDFSEMVLWEVVPEWKRVDP